MSEPIETKQVRQVARLARITLDPQHLEQVAQQLGDVLNYVEQLQSADVPDGTKPFFGAADGQNAVREDQVRPSGDRDQMLRNAPDQDGEYFLVPPVFE